MSEVKIVIEGEGLSLTKYTTLQKAGQIISFLGVDQNQPAERSTQGTPSALLEARLQPRDVIVNSGAKTYAQKIAALAQYLRNQLGQNTFSPQELRSLFKKIGDEPRNFGRDFKETVDRQYINCVDTATDQYELTDKGDGAVKNGFSEGNTKKASSSRRTIISKGIRDEIKQFEIAGSLEGYPDYHNLPTKADKILWLLEYADKKGVKSLTPAEVDFLSTQLRDRIKSNQFTALNERNVRKSFVTKTADGFLVQKKGADHLKESDQLKEQK